MKENELRVESLPEDVSVKVHGTDLMQIIFNLATNGLQCTDAPHSVEIRCRSLAHPLELSRLADGPVDRLINRDGFKNTGPLLAISIADTGPGIPVEVLPRIFVPYFTTKPASQGTGLRAGHRSTIGQGSEGFAARPHEARPGH